MNKIKIFGLLLSLGILFSCQDESRTENMDKIDKLIESKIYWIKEEGLLGPEPFKNMDYLEFDKRISDYQKKDGVRKSICIICTQPWMPLKTKETQWNFTRIRCSLCLG